MYGKFILLSIIVLVSSFITQNALAQIQFDPTPFEINDNGIYKPYKLTDNPNTATVQTSQGSFIFNKNTCSISFYNSTNTNGSPIIGNENYTVLASQGNTGIWNPVSIINNAACIPNVKENNGVISITGTKSVTGAGVFSVNYTKTLMNPMKITFSATNNNPAWTNYHIGLADNLQVPRFVSLGNQTYDLSQYNNTVLSRSWITSHNSQLIKLTNNAYYNMGLGWNNANDITVHWINNQASLTIDYTYNTPILSPGQTITVDPSITLDTSVAGGLLSSAGTNATQNLSITIGSNPSRAIIVTDQMMVQPGGTVVDPNLAGLSSVKIGSLSFTKAVNKTTLYQGGAGKPSATEIWYLVNPPTGPVHITLTPASTTGGYYLIAGAYSLYNVKQTSTIGTTNSTSGSVSPAAIEEIPTAITSWLIDSMMYDTTASFTSNSNTAIYTTIGAGCCDGGSQYKSSPSAGHNLMSYTMGSNQVWRDVMAEIKVNPGTIPSTPTLTHANTLNQSAIKLDWPSVSGATFYIVKQASPYTGSYSQIANQSSNTLTVNSLTPGTQYGFKIDAGNSSGTSSDSGLKSNYTTNIAPTTLTPTIYSNSSVRITVTNPTGNFSDYKISYAKYPASTFSSVTTSNTTNHYDFTGLSGNSNYTVYFATQYAKGTNSSGFSSNSTKTSFYTLPGAPNHLLVTQMNPLSVMLTWNAPNDNGTVLGYKIERFSSSWSTIVSNTGTTTTNYNDTLTTAGTYQYRVSTIKYGGTSAPSSAVSKNVYGTFTITTVKGDNATLVAGNIFQTNSSSSNNIFSAPSGIAFLNGLTGNQNFTFKDSSTLFVTKKAYNQNTTSLNSLRMITYDYYVDCSSDGTGNDFELFTNGTTNHIIQTFAAPTCYSNNTIKWKIYYAPNGNSLQNDTTSIRIQVLNNTFGANPSLIKANTTTVTSSYAPPWIVSNSVTVGNGLTKDTIYFSANMALNPAYTPINYTAGSLNVTGSNTNIQSIQFSKTNPTASTTVVTMTYPTNYDLLVTTKFALENQTKTFSGLTKTTVDAAHVSSSITFTNASNDIISIKAVDIHSGTNGNYSLSQNTSSIPLISQIQNFRSGTYGTTGQIGFIDLITLIVLIFSMVGLNRVNETLGLFFTIIVFGALSFYGIVSFPLVMIPAIALVLLVTVGSTKKLPWS